MLWHRFIWLFILFLLGRHLGYPETSRYMELADSADFYIAHENWLGAEKTILEALRLEPANFSNSMLLANLGLVQTQQGEYGKALNSLSLGLNMAPSSTVLLNNRAHTYLLIDSVSLALKDLDRSLEIDSIQEWTLQTRAFSYLQDSNLDEALKLFNKIKENFPKNSAVYSGMAAINEINGDYKTAIENYKTALSINSEDDEAREAYIFLLIKNDNYTEARSELRKAIELNPENPMLYLLRGYLHRLNFRQDEAQADKKLAISKGIDPGYASSFIP